MVGALLDDSSAEVQRDWDAVLGDGYCHIAEAYADYGPAWKVESCRMISANCLFLTYWCAMHAPPQSVLWCSCLFCRVRSEVAVLTTHHLALVERGASPLYARKQILCRVAWHLQISQTASQSAIGLAGQGSSL